MIIELVGGPSLARDLERIARKGRIAVIGLGAGSRVEIEFGLLMQARGRIHGSNLRGRTGEEKAEVIRRLGSFVQLHPLTVPVEATYPLERTQDAYERFAAGGKFGKIVVVP